MNPETTFYIGIVRLISYIIVLCMSIISIIRKRNHMLLWIGDLIFVIMSITSFILTQIHGVALIIGTTYIITPAFFIWGLTRVADFFSVNNFLNHNGKSKK
jgi:hypothetical protein